jgi:hypothetical protein
MLDFLICGTPFTEYSGGGLVLYELARTIKTLGYSVKLYASQIFSNNIFNDFYDINSNEITDTTIVIYPEIISGNPLNAKRVIRWLLCKIGINTPVDIIKSWGSNDIIYFYSSFDTKINSNILPYMFVYYNDPKMKNNPEIKRVPNSSCYTYRKAKKFSLKNNSPITILHDENSSILKKRVNHDIQILYFSSKQYFYCYDHYTGLVLNAIKCGCVSVVPKIENVDEMQYLKSGIFGYIDTRIPGLAYGIEEIPWANQTKDKINDYLDKLVSIGIDTVKNMIQTIESTKFENMTNTLENLKNIL